MKKDLLNVKLLMILNLISFSLLKSISLYAASESTQSFSLSGTLYQSGTTTPLHDPNVVMLIQIINPDKTCLLYEEQQVISVGSNGFFNVTVGSMTGSSKRTSRDPNQSMATIFQNTGMIFANNLQNASCIGGLYMPSATDTRYIRVTITPSSTGVPDQMTPDIALNSTPSAIVAQSVQGLERNSILQKKESSSIYLNQTNLEWLFNSGNYTKLQKLLAGELVASQNNGVSLPKSSTDPSSATEGAIWYDSVNKVIKFYDGTSSLPLGAAGSGFTTLTVGSDMTANGTAGGTLVVPGGTIDLKNSGVTAGTYTKFTVNTKGLVSSGSTLVESDIPTLSSAGKVSGSAITSGQISGSTSINTTGNITTTGTVTSNNISTNAVYSPSINGGSNASSNLTLDSTAHATKGNIILAPSGGGKVGIGTSTPGATLDVKGEIRMSGATSGYTGFKPAATAGSTIWTLPAVDGANGQVLTTNGSATLTWSTPSGSGISSLNGLTGGTQTYAIGTTGTSANWDSTGTVHTLNIPVSSTASVTAGLLSNADYITFSNKLSASTTFSGDVSGAYNSTSVDKIKGVAVSATAPSAAGQLLRYDGASSYVPAFISLADVRSTVTPTNTMFPSSSCSSSQTLTWSSLTDTMSCTNITGFVTSVATGTGLSGGTITSTGTISLADTAVTAGSYGSSTSVSTFTVDAQGRLTAASSAAIPTANTTTTGLLSNTDWNTFNGKLGTATAFSGDVSGAYNSTSVDKIKGVAVSATAPSTGGEFLVYNGTTQYAPVAISGDATMSSTGALTLKNTGTAGTYGSATQTPVLTTDAQGRVTGVTNTTITPAWSSISSKPTTLTGYGITDAILNAGGTPSIESGVLASRPAFGNAGSLYVSTDNNTIYRDTGSAWVAIGDGAGTGTVTSVATGTGLSGGTITSTGTISLADTAVTAGSYGSSTSVSTFTVDAQGRLTAASSAAIPTANTTTTGLLSNTDWNTFNGKLGTATAFSGDVSGAYNSTSVDKIKGTAVSTTAPSTGGEFLVYNGTTQYAPVAISGDATMSSTGALTLKNTGTAGTYGSATQTPVLTTDAQGRVTGVTNTTITPAWSSISSKPTTLSGYGITDAILNAGGTPSIESGVLASRPAFGNAGSLYVSTDNNTIYRDTGSAWVAIGDGAGTGTVTSVATGTGLTGGTITSTGTISLADTAVTAGSYGSSTSVSTFTVDAQGRLTAASSAAIPTANTTTTGLLSNTDWNTFNSKQAAGSYITALTGDVTGSGPGSTSTTIANDAITTVKILNGAVSTDKIADSSVTTIKLADNSVTTTKALSANPGINRLIMTDGTTGANLVAKSCSLGEILNWTATGWDCTSISGGSGDFKADGSVPMTGTLKMGGNTIYGNSTSGGNLTFDSTSNATKGYINMAVSGGNVGIGTASPTDKLHVNGSMTVNAINLNGNTIQASTGNSVILKPGIASAYFAVATTAVTAYNFPELVLLGGTTTTLKLNSGNASIWNFNTNYAVNNNLTISPSVGGGNMIISGTNLGIGVTNPTTKLQVAGEISPGTDNAYPLGDASLRFTAVYAVNGTIQTSDERQKKEIQNSDLGLEFINQLRPVSYYWKSGSDSSLHYGLIAQETKAVINGIKNETKNSTIDQSANLSTDTIVTYDKKSDRYGIKYSELIAPIIKAVQELNSKVNSILEKMQESSELISTKVDQEEFEKVKKESLDKDKKIESLQKEISEIKLYLCSKDAKSDLCL